MNKPYLIAKITELPQGGFFAQYVPSFTNTDVEATGATIEDCIEDLSNKTDAASALLLFKTQEKLIGVDYITKQYDIELKYEIHLTKSTFEKLKIDSKLKIYFQSINTQLNPQFFFYE